MHYIYQITNLKNINKIYIGQSTDPDKRWKEHQEKSTSVSLRKDIKKYGIDNFEFKVIEETESQEEANDWEINLIANNECIDKGYNSVPGGILTRLVHKCDKCGHEIKYSNRRDKKGGEGMVFWKTEGYTRKITDLQILCKQFINGCDPGHEEYPLSRELSVDTMGSMYSDYDMPDHIAHKYMMVDGKIDTFFTYQYLKKKRA
jgi:predicted GIY-YIG superfamily endonuclease